MSAPAALRSALSAYVASCYCGWPESDIVADADSAFLALRSALAAGGPDSALRDLGRAALASADPGSIDDFVANEDFVTLAALRAVGLFADSRLRVNAVRSLLSAAGVSFRRPEGGDFRVVRRGGSESVAYYSSDLGDALDTGLVLAAG